MKIVTVAALVLCMSFSVALAKEEAVKTGSAPKGGKADSSKVGAATKPVKDGAGEINKAAKLIKEIAAIPKIKIPPVVLQEADAVLIVPKAAKRSFMVSGGSTDGVLMVHDKGAWSSPLFITISGGTLGWQIVGDPMDIVLVFKNPKHIDAIFKDGLTLNTKVAIEPGWLGVNMKGATARVQKAEVASYVRSHGRFAEEAVVAGVHLQLNAAANDAFYSKQKVDAGDIVAGKVVRPTEEVKALQKQLADYAASAK